MAINLINSAAYLTPTNPITLAEGETMTFSMFRETENIQAFASFNSNDLVGLSNVNDFTFKVGAVNETNLFSNQVGNGGGAGVLYTFTITRGSTGGTSGSASDPDEFTYVINETEQGLGQEIVVATAAFDINRIGNNNGANNVVDSLIGVCTIGTRHSWDFEQTDDTLTQVPDTGTANEPLLFTGFDLDADYEWVTSSVPSPTKTVTFDIPSGISSQTGLRYAILLDSDLSEVTTGTDLDTSASTLEIDLAAFTSLSNGDDLILIATDVTDANEDSTGEIAWSRASVVVGA
ncbi:hypothetical protein [Glaciecola sp. 1036]|uniref:hypothetical protein n=1 Tax=Alteromonadaceae TaxID=72275 RepID=UPI003CFE0E92